MNEDNKDKQDNGSVGILEKTNSPAKMLPLWKVLLHNDNKSLAEDVINTIVELTPLKKEEAIEKTKEAHRTGVALILIIHRERAELYKDQFESKGLTSSIEPN